MVSFWFNFKDLIKVLINENNFKDGIEPNLENNLTYLDSSLFLNLSVVYKIAFIGIPEEQITKSYKFKKSVQQIIRKNVVEIANNQIELLVPNTDQTCYLTYFEGYPFDIPIYLDANRTIAIYNKRTQQQTMVALSEGVNRLFVSDGKTNFSLEGKLLLYIGLNELEFKINNNVFITLFLNKIDSRCGTYLKWFNQNGAYSYWLFSHIHTTKRKTKITGKIATDYENPQNTFGISTILGKTSIDTIQLSAGYLNAREIDIVSEIFTSPKVEIYLNDKYQKTDKKSWVGVEVKNSDQEIRSTRHNHSKYDIKIELPEIYTQTL